jgi:hypothetical protein
LALGLGLGPSTAQAARPGEDRGWRVSAEALGGLVGGAAGVFSSGMLGFGVCKAAGGGLETFGCILPAVVGAYVGGAVGIPLGVWGVGELRGADGGLGWTMLGSVSGAVVAGTLVAVTDIDHGDPAFWLLIVGLPLTGAILGYELSVESVGDPPQPSTTTATWGFRF